ncbi:hypothetical protein PV08_04615 [Exophiala spinifera]|uniref:Uncharacterized protein n=1 Tax=Exophiala spinifera TaxID=91928 RepID=A0A0D1YQA7_9EURO|nr:uncharacterized protein PV08_04615 [Exophiala spinifera]KIW17421.1 hypothetical protein PV08_04615 [Exophiala spinifera]
MAAVLENDEDGALKLAVRPNALSARNFLGQSALHLSVAYPKLLAKLLAFYEDLGVDMPDNVGATPLIYAACYGKADSIISLLRAGANPWIKDRTYKLNFMDCAIFTRHTNVLGKTVEETKNLYAATNFQNILNYIIRNLIFPRRPANVPKRCDYLRQFLSFGGDANTTYGDNSTLLHHVHEHEEVELLFEYGFDRINHADDDGVVPLMRLLLSNRLHIVRNCLRKGASTLSQDMHGWTAMHHVVKRFEQMHLSRDTFCSTYAHTIASIKMLLEHGADPRTTDHCRCACGIDGCSPSTFLAGSVRYRPLVPSVQLLDWVLLVQERTSELLFKEVLIQALRATRFRYVGLTHVCCGQSFSPRILEEADIKDTLDEERAEIQEFNESLETLTWLDASSLMEALIQEQVQHCCDLRNVVTDPPKGSFRIKYDAMYIKDYLEWIDSIYRSPKYPRFDQEWRGKRIYWVLRLEQAILDRVQRASESPDSVGDSKSLPEWHDIDLENCFYGVDVCLTILRLMWGQVSMRCLVVLGLYVVIEMIYQGW